MIDRIRIWIVVVTCWACGWCAPALSAEQVRIVVHDSAQIDHPLVHLADIATIETIPHKTLDSSAKVADSSADLLRSLAELDLVEFTSPSQIITFQRQQLAIRIRIAGIDLADVDIRGPHETQIRFVHPLTEERIFAAAREAIASHAGVPATRITWEPNGSVVVPHDFPWNQPVTLRANLPTPIQAVRTRVHVGIYQGEQLIRIIPITGTPKLMQSSLVATQHLVAGESITRRNSEVREVAAPLPADAELRNASKADPLDLLGAHVIRPVPTGQVITPNNTNTGTAASTLKIAARDRVRLIAEGKGLTVTVNDAEALEKASVGDTIRVRNPQSGRIVLGRVSPTGDVIVRY